MAQQIINIGSAPNDGTGDQLRTSFDKCNQNFTELYTSGAGNSTEGVWNFNQTSTDTTTAPASGRFRTNSGDAATCTQFAIHRISINGVDRAYTLRTQVAGDVIKMQDKANADTWARLIVQAPPVDNGTWFQIDVAFDSGGGTAPGNNQEIIFNFAASSGGAGGGGGGGIGSASAQGRLTLQTATPVMTTTQAAKTTIYYTPYVGNMVPIYDGSNMVMMPFTELSVATTDTTKSPAAIGVSKVNDWFVWNDAGTLRIGHGPDWTSDTARSAGTALVMINGILLNNASITNGPAAQRGTYIGTTRSNGSSQLDWIIGGTAIGGVAAFLNVWNMYNRVSVSAVSRDSTASWTYWSATIHAANSSNNNRVSMIRGLDEDAISATYMAIATAGASSDVSIGVGLDVTNSFASAATYSGTTTVTHTATYMATPGLGYHFIQAVEVTTTAANAATLFGVIGGKQVQSLDATCRA
jgi:Bacteriophage T4 gp9/10-like protein